MKILNLYAGIGGNRKLWGGEYQVTAVEFREDIAEVYRHFFPNDTVIIGDAHQYLLKHYKEFDFIWSSRPCQSHSRARYWSYRNSDKVDMMYPDMGLYEEIIFLKYYYDGKWVVENVVPYYNPLIPPTVKLGRHLFWSNFDIQPIKAKESDINRGTEPEWRETLGIDITDFKFKTRKDQIYRNCVHPETGKYILDCAMGIKRQEDVQQLSMF